MGSTRRTAALFISAIGLLQHAARADLYNRQLTPLGEREAFMANAGTGDASDTGAVYYNPAGLADIGATKVSLLGSVYLSFSTKADAVARIDDTAIPIETSGFNTIPATYVAATTAGDWRLALSVLVPDSTQVDNRLGFSTTHTRGNVLASTRAEDLWVGLTAAVPLGSDWAIGLTVFGMRHFESSISGLALTFPGSANSVITQISRGSLSAYGLSVTGGVSYHPADWASLGLRLQSPFVQLSGKADVFAANYQVDNGALTPQEVDRKDVDARYRLPLDMTLGTALHLGGLVDLLVDGSLQLGEDYETLPDVGGSARVRSKTALRLNAGAELRAIRSLPLRVGYFYNPSAVGDFIEGTANQTRLDFHGVTGGVTYEGERVETGVGVLYAWGSGQTNPTESITDLVGASSRGFGVILTTAYVF